MYKYQNGLIFQGEDSCTSVEVVQEGNLRTLHFGTEVAQSSMYLDDPFKVEMEYNQVMLLSLIYNPNPSKILILGLGGGAKQKFFWKHTKGLIHTVEISPLVVEIGCRFFNIPCDERLIIFQENAYHFLQRNNENTYDFIFVDLYDKEGMSSVIGLNNFFQLCRKNLKPQGILVWNLWRHTQQVLKDNTLHFLEKAFSENFMILKVEESLNLILYAFNEPVFQQNDLLNDNAKKLSQRTGINFIELLSKQSCFKMN